MFDAFFGAISWIFVVNWQSGRGILLLLHFCSMVAPQLFDCNLK